MKSEEEARRFYEHELQSIVQPLEVFRCQKVAKLKAYFIWGCLFSLIFFVLLFFHTPLVIFFLLGALISFGMFAQILQKTLKALQIHFKTDVLPLILEYLFENYRYIPRQRFAKSVVEKSLLISSNMGLIEGEDYMRFQIGETDVAFCEMCVYGHSSSTRVLFKGIFMSSSFNKTFTSQTIVTSRKLSILIKNFQRIVGYERVKLEDVEFEKEFVVYSTDQVESRYILTPGLMKRIVDYKRKTRRDISLSFSSNRLYLTIPNHVNLFEPALFNSFNSFDFMQKSYDALRFTADLVDDLHLNLRIWGKQ